MKIRKPSNPTIAFVMTSKDLTKLNEHIRDYLGTNAHLTFTAHCTDHIRYFDTVAQLQQFENSKGNAINRLTIEGRSEDYEKTVEMNLGQTMFSTPLSISVSGQELPVQHVVGKLEDDCEGMRAWYSWFASFEVTKLMMWSGIIATISFLLLGLVRGKPDLFFQTTNINVFFVILEIALLLALFGCFAWARAKVFPVSVFAIGQGERRHQTPEMYRLIFLVGFLLSLCGSLVGSVIWAILTSIQSQ